MEEIKEEAKEITSSEEYNKKIGKFKLHHCCGSKSNMIILTIAIAILIFSSGVYLGLNVGRNHEARNFGQFPNEQRNYGRMMKGNNIPDENGGCQFRERINQGQVQEQIEVQTQVPAQVQQVQSQTAPAATIQVVAPTQVKTVTPAK